MHCAKRLALLSGAIEAIAATATPIGFPHVPDRVLADHPNSFLSRRARQDLVRTVNLVVRKHAVFEHEPPPSPSFPVVHPLVQNPSHTATAAAAIAATAGAIHHRIRDRIFAVVVRRCRSGGSSRSRYSVRFGTGRRDLRRGARFQSLRRRIEP